MVGTIPRPWICKIQFQANQCKDWSCSQKLKITHKHWWEFLSTWMAPFYHSPISSRKLSSAIMVKFADSWFYRSTNNALSNNLMFLICIDILFSRLWLLTRVMNGLQEEIKRKLHSVIHIFVLFKQAFCEVYCYCVVHNFFVTVNWPNININTLYFQFSKFRNTKMSKSSNTCIAISLIGYTILTFLSLENSSYELNKLNFEIEIFFLKIEKF